MIEKCGPTFEVTCDFCPEDIDTGEDEFHAALSEIKSQGWRIFKKRSEWHHKCPACVEADSDVEFNDERF